MNKHIFIVNGKPRAGKDTFAEILNKYVSVYKCSIIDPIKTAALELGWKGGKTEKDRKFLSDLLDLTMEYSEAPYDYLIEKGMDFWDDKIKEDIMLIDIRDPEVIDKVAKMLGASSIFISNKNVPEITSNHADANVDDYDYDYGIDNSGTLEDFEKSINVFLTLLDIQDNVQQDLINKMFNTDIYDDMDDDDDFDDIDDGWEE